MLYTANVTFQSELCKEGKYWLNGYIASCLFPIFWGTACCFWFFLIPTFRSPKCMWCHSRHSLPQMVTQKMPTGACTSNNSFLRTRIVVLSGLKLIPESCNGLSVIQGRELHMRFQLQKDQLNLGELAHLTMIQSLVRIELQQLRSGSHTICCRTCGNTVLPVST